MKPKPLKGKLREKSKGIHRTPHRCFSEKDILSAVEWLKSKVTHTYGCEKLMKEGVKCRCDYNERIELIDKAFEDVIKK